jgi:hypothetical protein
MEPLKFVPIYDIEAYIRARGATGQEADDLREKHKIPPKPVVKEEHSFRKLKYFEEGYVNEKGKMVYPYAEALPYIRANKSIPFEVRIRCMAKNGVPDDVLMKLIKKQEKYNSKKEVEKREKEFIKLFGESEKKKVLKAVKKAAPTFD